MAKILVVEDEAIINEPFCLVLRSQGHEVDAAYNGNEASGHCKKTTYDLILLDIMMPVCNGLEFLRNSKIKQLSPGTKVIIMSNLSGGKDVEEALKLGAQKSLLKASVTPKLLIELVNNELTN